MARFRSNKRAKELQRKAKHEAKEVRKKERQERSVSGEADPDIDWSQAVGIDPPPDWRPPGEELEEDESDDEGDDEAEPAKSAS